MRTTQAQTVWLSPGLSRFEEVVGHLEKKTMEDRWLSVDEIGAYLGVKRDTVYKWISEKAMPAHKMGRLWKFKSVEVDEWVRQGGARERHVEQDSNA